jgi:HAD superfamily hydrolase (TIGR01549 family)
MYGKSKMKKYNAVFLDLDNTLYSYHDANEKASAAVLDYLHAETGFDKSSLAQSISLGRESVHRTLSGVASSHNRLLYFQKASEIIGFPYVYVEPAHRIFWDTFIDSMSLREGVSDFLTSVSVPMFLVTDMTAEIQFRKLEKLNLLDRFNGIISSEEAGVEKPHPYIYMLALKKAGFPAESVCMIGDDWKKDILGAVSMGMDAYWFEEKKSAEKNQSDKIHFFNDFHELIGLIK